MKIQKLINRLNTNFNTLLNPPLVNSCYQLLCNTDLKYKDIEPYLNGPENEFIKIPLTYYNSSYNMYLVRWGANHSLPRHDHPNCRCLYKLIEGGLEEILFTNNKEYKSNLIDGEVRYIDNDMGEHSVKNTKNNYSYSIHLYFLKE
jgi:hypothetical protein